jgi:hypothetical protein
MRCFCALAHSSALGFPPLPLQPPPKPTNTPKKQTPTNNNEQQQPHSFTADIAFDGEELARRALDRTGRVRLYRALHHAMAAGDAAALDAALMQVCPAGRRPREP